MANPIPPTTDTTATAATVIEPQPVTPPATPAAPAPKMFTQEEVNSMMAARVARMKPEPAPAPVYVAPAPAPEGPIYSYSNPTAPPVNGPDPIKNTGRYDQPTTGELYLNPADVPK